MCWVGCWIAVVLQHWMPALWPCMPRQRRCCGCRYGSAGACCCKQTGMCVLAPVHLRTASLSAGPRPPAGRLLVHQRHAVPPWCCRRLRQLVRQAAGPGGAGGSRRPWKVHCGQLPLTARRAAAALSCVTVLLVCSHHSQVAGLATVLALPVLQGRARLGRRRPAALVCESGDQRRLW